MTQQDEMRELCRGILKHGLMLSEQTEELVSNYQGDGVEQELMDTVDSMLRNTSDNMRAQRICMLTMNIGQRLGSQRVSEHGEKRLQEYQ